MPFGYKPSRRRRIEPSVAIEQLVFLRPDRRELRDLLVLRHAREQIFHALFNGGCGVAIGGAGARRAAVAVSSTDARARFFIASPCRATRRTRSYLQTDTVIIIAASI